jgi:hypothetical protein
MTITQRVVRNARRRGVTIYSRKRWGTLRVLTYQWRRIFKKHSLLPTKPADTLWQHITVTRPSGDFKADVRKVEDIGWFRFGTGTSYNFLVDMTTGEAALGMPLDAKGAHTLNVKHIPGYSFDQNAVSLAVAVIGMPDTELSHAAKLTITRLVAAMIDEGALTMGHDYNPHSMVAAKDCPCDNTREAMPEINKGARRLARS